MNTDRQTCAVCAKPIRPGLLMCAQHWRLVPSGQQRLVLARYGHWQRHKGAPEDRLKLIRAYREARDAAVASVLEAINPSTPTGDIHV